MARMVMTLIAGVAALSWAMPAGLAADYPARPVITFTSAGLSEALARIFGKKLEQILGQPFVSEGRSRAAEQVARAPADGHVLLMGNDSILATSEVIFRKINFDPEADFAPISLIGSQAYILVVNPRVPARTMGELITYAKAHPGKVNYASAAFDGVGYLAAELFRIEAKVEIVHVPYKGAARALQDLVAGRVQILFASAASVAPHIHSGKVRALAVTTLKRTSVFPEIATVDELGLKGFDAATWHGLVAPSRTPKEVIATLHRAAVAALNDAAVRKSLGDLGVDIVGGTPEEFAAYIRAEIPKWTAIVKASGATLE